MKLSINIHKHFPDGSKSILISLLYALLVAIAVVLPVILWQLNLSIIERTFDGSVPGMLDSQPFELFGFFISLVLIVASWLKIRKLEKKTVATLAPIILPMLVSLEILFFLLEDSHPQGSDYRLCYENAAQAIVNGVNPYSVKCFLYPPLPAQALAFLYQVVNASFRFAPADVNQIWTIVFYLYQSGQYLQILLAYYLTHQLAKRMGLRVWPAIIIVSALFLFNDPLVRTIKFNQINVWILNSFLLAVLWIPRRALFSGLAVALGAHIKLYTLALLLPWILTKQWRAVVGVIAGFSTILMFQTGFGQNWALWQQFLEYFTQRVEKPSNYRNSGIWSFVYNLFKIPSRLVDDFFLDYVPLIVTVINVLIVVWFILRILKREKGYSELVKASESNRSKKGNEVYRLYGHSIDAIALGLLISPSVWEHHYVLAIPIALWAIVTCERDKLWLVGIATFLIFCVPTFEIFPLSHHRMVGLLMLVYLTSPALIQQHFYLQRWKPMITPP